MELALSPLRIVDLILALIALEAVALLGWRARTGGGIAAAPLLGNLAAGAALLVALRLALSGASPALLALALAAAGIAHLFDLAIRWNPQPKPASGVTGLPPEAL